MGRYLIWYIWCISIPFPLLLYFWRLIWMLFLSRKRFWTSWKIFHCSIQLHSLCGHVLHSLCRHVLHLRSNKWIYLGIGVSWIHMGIRIRCPPLHPPTWLEKKCLLQPKNTTNNDPIGENSQVMPEVLNSVWNKQKGIYNSNQKYKIFYAKRSRQDK